MHFDSFALKDLYFIDSQWLCDVFAHVVSPKCNGKYVRLLHEEQCIQWRIELVICGKGVKVHTIKQPFI